MSTIKEEAKKIIDALPESATWDDIMYKLYVKQKLDNALQAAQAGQVISHADVKKRLLRNEN